MGDGYELYNDFKSDDFFACYLDGQIMGFIGLHNEGAVGLLHIDKAHREKGFGYEMAAFMLAHQMEKGRIPYGQIYESNKASLELNASLGMELSEGRLYWVTNRKFITYKETKDFKADDIERLFLSVNWESGRYPEKLVKAMHNSTHVVSAWDRDRLVGLVRALDDGETVAFLHYLLVDPEYQGMKIGEELMKRILAHFENHLYVKIMTSNPKTIPFYEKFGFQIYDNYSAMVRRRGE
ncbi:MAG: GNAT family N-acetyltransferase [Lachnospiraceae bacterium]|nr:GNAT family N-acetyltransferase [Lachnospiraceae bacterium]